MHVVWEQVIKAGFTKGFFGNYLPTIGGRKHICAHFHRTAGGAERCAKEQIRFLEKVEKLRAQKEHTQG